MPFDGIAAPLGFIAKFDQVIDRVSAPDRWVKHRYRDPGDRQCLKEALNTAGLGELLEPVVLRAADKHMNRDFCCVESFNDNPLTTHADIVAVLYTVRAEMIAGRVELPTAGEVKSQASWHEYYPPASASRAGGLWRRFFRWS
jgi:hypothetical protein